MCFNVSSDLHHAVILTRRTQYWLPRWGSSRKSHFTLTWVREPSITHKRLSNFIAFSRCENYDLRARSGGRSESELTLSMSE